MPLWVDDREGSSELLAPLAAMGLPVEEKRLAAGDLAWVGRGEGGEPVSIGVEYKKLSDLVQSLNDGRLLANTTAKGGQIPRMVRTYDRNYLVVEGDWERAGDGKVHTWKGPGKRRPLKGAPHAIQLRKQMFVVELRWGIKVVYCKSRRDVLDTIFTWYRVWTDKDLDAHKSHLAIHAPDSDTSLRFPMSNFRAGIQAWLPGVGFAASKAIEDWVTVVHDGRAVVEPYRLMLKTHKDWAELSLPGKDGKRKRLGESRAKAIMEELGTWGR